MGESTGWGRAVVPGLVAAVAVPSVLLSLVAIAALEHASIGPPWEALAIWIGLLTLLEALLAVVLIRIGAEPRRAWATSAWTMFGALSFLPVWTAFSTALGEVPLWLTWVIALGLIALGATLGWRVPNVEWVLTIVLVVSIGSAVVGTSGPGPPIPAYSSEARSVPALDWPLVVIILDSMPSPAAMAIDDIDPGADLEALRGLGFRVWEDSRTNYSNTWMSVPALLDGNYPVAGRFGPDQTAALHAGLGADTALLRGLQAQGREISLHEAPWSLSRCSPSIDACFESGLIDEIHWAYFLQTPIPHLFPHIIPHPYARAGIEMLESVRQPAPDSVDIYHAMIPHDPFVLDETCAFSSDATSQTQVRCALSRLLSSVRSLDLSQTVVVVAGDHGFPTRGQLGAPPEAWTDTMVRERFGAFLAISHPEGCEELLGDPVSHVNVLPALQACSESFSGKPDRYYISIGHSSSQGTAWLVEWPRP